MGFSIIEGPEIETEYYNFDALNIPANHPAREMCDTFWIKSRRRQSGYGASATKLLLRTHTSPMQIRYMETHQPPFRIIVPGRCFRYEATDPSHEIQFHQVEGLMVGKNISLANFKAVIEEVVKDIFKQKVLIRFRPSYFPFVAPGVEVDIKLNSKACPERSRRIKTQNSKLNKRLKIKENEWLEIMGAGMVHPDLFKRVGYKNNCWQGFAFGLGVERIAMIKYGIDDIRLFFGSDIRFLEQF
jgi:phenylalanyl-tRNA synthetase alpha chain